MRKAKRRDPAGVDANVPIVANRKHGEALECAAACAGALYEIKRKGVLVMDSDNRIFEEYKAHLSFAGQPGAGDSFFKWLYDNRYRQDRVKEVNLADDPTRVGEFAVFPKDPELATFDRSDRKFVAVALTHPETPPILNAADRAWRDHQEALKRNGVR